MTGAVDRSDEPWLKFRDVLRDELAIVAARRERLDTERGDPPDRAVDPQEAAWKARLLGLSFSGGGIRSATFNLGVLQALASRGVLRYVDYLSTVSGGGYIGSWLTALTQRRFARTAGNAKAVGAETQSLLELGREGFKKFEAQLAWAAGDTSDDGPAREDRAIGFLREFSNYLTPKLGLFSGDTWALIAIYVRNALLNQLVLLLALLAVLLVPRLFTAVLGHLEAASLAPFLLWMLPALMLHVALCYSLGRNLAGITALTGSAAPPSPRVLRQIGAPLLLLAISSSCWLGYVGTWSWPAAAVLGALVSFVTWWLASVAARGHAGRQRNELEAAFWTRMLWYAAPAGAVFGLLLHAIAAWLFADGTYAGFKLVAAPPALALAILPAGALHIGLAGKNVSAQYTEWLSRFGGLVLVGAIGWLAFNALVFFGPLIVAWLEGAWQLALSSGWLLTTLGSVVFSRSVVASSGRFARLFMTVAPYVFIVGLGVGAAALLQAGLHEGAVRLGAGETVTAARNLVYRQLGAPESATFGVLDGVAASQPRSGSGELLANYGAWLGATDVFSLVLGAIVAAAVLTWFVSRRVDVNVFSLNGMYANRLVRCYLGASVPQRTPNKFSGLSTRDDLQLKVERRAVGGVNMLVHPLADGELAGDAPAERAPTVYPGPYHLINTAINLVAGGNLAYQERKAGSFLLSPLYCGFELPSSSSEGADGVEIDAYRPTARFSSDPRQLTLGEAVATSGAAASPNMGYHSTPAFAFLMGVFNIRLGRWVGNPYTSDGNVSTWRKTGPKLALFHLLREVFGLTDKKSGYVYLSDGGHFENLGIYELVRRRCRYIVACDAGADPYYGFEDLGNAIRKCRTDLGVEIELDVRQIAATDAERYNGAPCAVGYVRYSEHEVGTILYIKASRRAGVPSDVMHYATQNAAFPHEPTADQFFSESQFESYRRLGYFLASEILKASRAEAARSLDIDRLFRELSERWYRPSTAPAASFGSLADAVDGLFERLGTKKELAFLSNQFYPEWRALLHGGVVDAKEQTKDLLFVPRDDEDQLRQGFYFCNSLIQLMENAYVALRLETDWQHPDNSGWLNVFNHWAWSGMFRVTWAVSAATYGGRFRTFCEERLNLRLGDVHAQKVLVGAPDKSSLSAAGLNAHEQQQIVDAYVGSGVTVYRLDLHVSHPIDDKALMTFGFGYAVMRGDELVLYRVQDHLRGMGLGRLGLVALANLDERKTADGKSRRLRLDTLDQSKLLAFFAQFKEQTDRAKLADFRAMVASVNEEAEAE